MNTTDIISGIEPTQLGDAAYVQWQQRLEEDNPQPTDFRGGGDLYTDELPPPF